MKKQHTPLIVGNWKMNPATLQKSVALFTDIKKKLGTKKVNVEIVVAPPSLYIPSLSRLVKKSQVALGAQDVSSEIGGAHTGDVSVSMLKDQGVTHVILGHSERRALGENDMQICKKVSAALQSSLTAIVCVGEKVRDAHGNYFNDIELQVEALLQVVQKKHLPRLVIAYEPIWAIGTQQTATSDDVQEMKLFIQKIIAQKIDRTAVAKVRIIYGGSVTKDNAEALLTLGTADGFLVGGASLQADAFTGIIRISDQYGNKKT